MIERIRPRWLFGAAVACGVVILVWGGFTISRNRRDRRSYDAAIAAMGAGDLLRARMLFRELASRSPADGDLLFRLGQCELATGELERAERAWEQVPRTSAMAPDAAIQLAQLNFQAGKFAEAERILRAALEESSSISARVRRLLLTILIQEGRIGDAARVLESPRRSSANSITRADELQILRDHFALDFETAPLRENLAFLESIGQIGGGDERYWLARAHLANQSGRLEEAARWLDAILLRNRDDTAAWRERLDWALAAGRIDAVKQSLGHLPADALSTAAILRVRAWLAAKREDHIAERRALEALEREAPADTPALSRLSELALLAGEPEISRHYREKKTELDALADRYRRIFKKGDFSDDLIELSEIAARLGRRFESDGFRKLAGKPPLSPKSASDSLEPRAGSALARFAPEEFGAVGASSRSSPTATILAVAFDDGPETAPFGAFRFDNGESSLHQLPEFAATGVGVLDYDGDGRLDVFAVQGGPFPPKSPPAQSGDRLWRNLGGGRFEDVTARTGIGRLPGGFGYGVSVGDYDNDGHPDIFLTRWRSYALYHNKGDGTFEDGTAPANLAGDRDWPTSSAFADLDNDGDLDLYVCHYGEWDTANPRLCKDPTGQFNTSCDPRLVSARPDHLFRNDKGRFVDVTESAGIVDPDGRGLGVVAADLDADGMVDLFVANDSTANYLFHNLGGFRFEEVGQTAGVAANAAGGYQAGMGIACGDLDGDGRPDLAVTNFYGESTSLFHNLGHGFFADHTALVGLAAPSRFLLGFGLAFLDANNDGWLDLLSANGHVSDLRPSFPYAMTPQLYLGSPGGKLTDVSAEAGSPFERQHVGRGLAIGDIDNDGRVDALIVAYKEPLVYLHNRTEAAGVHFVTIALEGRKSNRDGVGAVVTLTAAKLTQMRPRFGGGSFQSAGDPRLHFGLGSAEKVDRIEVRWPSGQIDRFQDLNADRGYRLIEGDASPKLLQGFAR
jgi:thioredoxin-like negative regulator of GroEL